MIKKKSIIANLIYSIYSRRGIIMRNVILSTFMMASAFTSLSSYAASPATGQFNVMIKVKESCEIKSTNDVNFADIDRSTNEAKTAQGNLSVLCTVGTPYKVALAGTGKMTNSADANSTIAYNLFQNSAYDQAWDSQNLNSKVGDGTAQQLDVYAKLTSSTNVKAGNYQDRVTATVTY